jgi:hypothetical protein
MLLVKAQCTIPKWMSQTMFFQEMNFNRMLHDNWIEYFMVWTQIYMVVCICNEMHRSFLQLELLAWCFWTFKKTNVSCNK